MTQTTSSPEYQFPILIGDIGGTNARFQIVEDSSGNTVRFEIATVADHETPEAAVAAVLRSWHGPAPRTAILAAAGQADETGMSMTNSHWRIDAISFMTACSCSMLVLLNDFEAQAMALPGLGPNDVEIIGGGDRTNHHHCKVALGPGTGLGVGLLIRAGARWIPVPGEGGHMDLGSRTAREAEIWPHLDTIGGRISAEQCLSGNGLINLYRAVCTVENRRPELETAATISSAAVDGSDGAACEALMLFCMLLGRVAGDLALVSMAYGGVYLGGGITNKILPFLQRSPFRSAFEDKAPHEELLKRMPTYVVSRDLPALAGLAAYACHPEEFAVDIDDRIWKR